MAMPRLTSSRSMRAGVVSSWTNAAFIRGNCLIAVTSAHAMMCVKDAFGCPVSVRWLLMTRRFSSRTLTGMLRMEVAVGIVSDISMFWAILPAAPRSATAVWSLGTGVGRGAGAGAGCWVAGVLGC